MKQENINKLCESFYHVEDITNGRVTISFQDGQPVSMEAIKLADKPSKVMVK